MDAAEILLVDDERAFREGLRALLESEGFAVRTARDGDDALRKIAERRPDLVILDVMMPKTNGFRACEEIRRSDRRIPVVFLTAKDAAADQVRALGLGADDYVTKDAPESLLLARVRRAIERSRELAEGPPACVDDVVRLGRVVVNLSTLDVTVAGRAVDRLTKTESDVLRVLCASRGRRVATDEMIVALRGRGFACEDSMLYVHVSNLRRKLGPAASMISSVRGAGYCLSTRAAVPGNPLFLLCNILCAGGLASSITCGGRRQFRRG